MGYLNDERAPRFAIYMKSVRFYNIERSLVESGFFYEFVIDSQPFVYENKRGKIQSCI